MTENKFNLIDALWIPIAGVGQVSLRQVFTERDYSSLGGNPIQKIVLMKLLLAIVQMASTPKDNYEWEELDTKEMAEKCLAYLENNYDKFYLYGDKPFLQMLAIKAAKIQPYGAVFPEVSTGNTTILTQSQLEKKLFDADKAMLLIVLMGFGLGGKKTDNSIVLSENYTGKTKPNGKPTTGKPSASLGFMGFLHSFLQGETLLQTLWLNLLDQTQIDNLSFYSQGLGIAPWELMPEGENCPTAQQLQNTLMGRLIPLSRFCFLTEDGLHYSEGIAHLSYKEGMIEPSLAVKGVGDKAKVLWAETERRPWRSLTALLSFMEKIVVILIVILFVRV